VAGHEVTATPPPLPAAAKAPVAAPAAVTPPPIPAAPATAARPKIAPPASDRVAAIRAANAQAAAARAGGASAVAGKASTAPAAPGHADKPRTVPVPWRRCQNHPQTRSLHVCPKCTKGYCEACAQMVQSAAICPACEGLCLAAAAYEEGQERSRVRARSMMDEIGVIAAYPLTDPLAYVLLALFTWFFGLFAGMAGIMVLLSKGVLTWYSFNAVSKVSIGKMREVMPEFRDVSDIAHALTLSAAALGISAGPLFLCLFLIPGADMLLSQRSASGPVLAVAHAQPPASPEAADEEDEAAEDSSHASADAPTSPFEADREGGSMVGPLAMLGIVLAVIWMIAYMPVALTVAALSKSVINTINPLMGADTIKKMGGTYWQALGIYTVIVLVQAVLGWGLRLIPVAGNLVASFVDAYAALAVGCTLGMAVFKKGAELGWD
jgi:hypothetical protein